MEGRQISQDSRNNKERIEIALKKTIEEIFEKHIKLLEPGKPHCNSMEDLLENIGKILEECMLCLKFKDFIDNKLAMKNIFQESIKNCVEQYVNGYNLLHPQNIIDRTSQEFAGLSFILDSFDLIEPFLEVEKKKRELEQQNLESRRKKSAISRQYSNANNPEFKKYLDAFAKAIELKKQKNEMLTSNKPISNIAKTNVIPYIKNTNLQQYQRNANLKQTQFTSGVPGNARFSHQQQVYNRQQSSYAKFFQRNANQVYNGTNPERYKAPNGFPQVTTNTQQKTSNQSKGRWGGVKI